MRILFVTSTRIGDAVLSTGLLDHLLEQYPQAKITIACGAPAAGIFKAMPNIEQIIIMHKKPYGRHWLDLWIKTCGKKWDIVLDLRRSILGYFLWAKHRYIARKPDPKLHRVQDMAQVLNLNPPRAPKLWLNDEVLIQARTIMPDLGKKPVLCIGPTANWGGKTWPAERFAELARRLTRADNILPHATIAIFGVESERVQARPLIESLHDLPVMDLIGKPDLLICAAIFQQADLYIGNDSGLMHMAAAVGGNVLGLFGPSQARHYAPWPSGSGKTGFVQTQRSYEELVFAPDFNYRSQQSLMTDLSVDMAEKSAIKLWDKINNRAAA